MELRDIFSEISSHAIKGMMFHDQLASYFGFLSLNGFKKEQEDRFISESMEYRRIMDYFVSHYNQLIPEAEIENPSVIPSGWYGHKREDVDTSTRRSAVKEAYDHWITWERETKSLYEKSVKELHDMGFIAASLAVSSMVASVDHELALAEQKRMELEACDYDSVFILDIQNDIMNRLESDKV